MSLDLSYVLKMEAKKPLTLAETKKVTCCSVCNLPIGLVSNTLYEMNGRHYCTACYSQIVILDAAKRDHADILKEKKLVKQPA